MPTIVLRPNATYSEPAAGTISPTGATALARVNDNSDATWVDRIDFTMIWQFSYANPTIPSADFVARVSGNVRYRGGTTNNFVVFYPWRPLNESRPVIMPAIFMGASAFTTAEIGRRIIDWPRATVVSLRSWFSENTPTGIGTVDYADVWIALYTITRSTATPSAATMVVTNTPTIPVAVPSTIDWESSLPTSSPLRKVTVEVRIEANSSTGAGTSAALLETTVDIVPTATGTDNLSIVMPGTLINGTYKVYARARRYSEASTPANESEMYSAWSSAATLTMNVTAMGAPTISATADNVLNRTALSVTVPSTSPYTSATVTVQRTADAGATWTTIRDADGVAIPFATATPYHDREAPLGVALLYRARAIGTYLTDQVTSAWSTNASVTLAAATRWNLRAPEQPSIDILGLNVIGAPEEQLGEEVGVFRPIDRRYPVVVAGELTGWDGSLAVETVTAADWAALEALVESQLVLLLQSPFGSQKYIRLVGNVKFALQGTPTTPRRRVALSYVETAAP